MKSQPSEEHAMELQDKYKNDQVATTLEMMALKRIVHRPGKGSISIEDMAMAMKKRFGKRGEQKRAAQ